MAVEWVKKPGSAKAKEQDTQVLQLKRTTDKDGNSVWTGRASYEVKRGAKTVSQSAPFTPTRAAVEALLADALPAIDAQ